MNTHAPSRILTAGIFGAFSLIASQPLLAIEPPPDNAKPPEALVDGAAKIDEVPAKLAFIGVVTAALPEMVADHVNLEPGIGIIIRTVMPKSPADLAGLKVNDIILNINETAVNDPEAFSEKIRSLKIGEKIKLKTIQKGKSTHLEVTLAERPADAIAGVPNQEPLIEGIQGNQAQLMRDLIERNLGALGEGGIEEMIIPDLLADERFKLLRERMNGGLDVAPGIQIEPGNLQFQGQATMRMMDEQGSIEIKSNGDNKEVTVRDQANKVIWSGPWDTDQDKAAAPDEIRNRIEKLNIQRGGGLRFELKR